jgi:hypothetical protein
VHGWQRQFRLVAQAFLARVQAQSPKKDSRDAVNNIRVILVP